MSVFSFCDQKSIEYSLFFFSISVTPQKILLKSSIPANHIKFFNIKLIHTRFDDAYGII